MIFPFPRKIFQKESEWVLTIQFQVLIIFKTYRIGLRLWIPTIVFNWGPLKGVSLDLTLCLLYGDRAPEGGKLRSKGGELIGLEGT